MPQSGSSADGVQERGKPLKVKQQVLNTSQSFATIFKLLPNIFKCFFFIFIVINKNKEKMETSQREVAMGMSSSALYTSV